MEEEKKEIITRNNAIEQEKKYFYTGVECRNGHDSVRYTNDGKCVKCVNNRVKKYKDENKEKVYQSNKKYRENNVDAIRKKKQKYRTENKERIKQRDSKMVCKVIFQKHQHFQPEPLDGLKFKINLSSERFFISKYP